MKRYKYLIISTLALITLVGCTSDFDSVNTDPLSIENPSPTYILPYVEQTGIHVQSWEYQVGDNLHSNLYAQYLANSASYFDSGSYTYNSTWITDGYWTPYYNGVLKYLKIVKTMAEKDSKYSNIYQMMRIYGASCTASITDIFGDIPYTEASKGNSQPVYDSQKSIYYDIFNELTEAAEALTTNKSDIDQEDPGSEDLIFSGNVDKWIKLANSLRLRYALRLYYIDETKSKTEAEAALAAGVMTSNDDNAGVYVSNAGDNGYPLFQISGWGEFCMSKTMENILKSTSTVDDPRMPIWFGKTVNYVNGTSTTAYQGLANGLSATDVTAAGATNYSYVWGLYTNSEWSSGKDISNYKIAKRMKVMNYAEVCLLKAEAALRGFSGAGSISDDYETGIKASFASERSDVTDASLYSTANDETYITTGNVKWDSSASTETKLKQIITQKWLALYPNGIEAWAEFRRTGYPELTPVAVSLESSINPSNDEFIKKLRYIDDEINSNPNASNTSLNKNKGDGMDVRVWWDTERYK